MMKDDSTLIVLLIAGGLVAAWLFTQKKEKETPAAAATQTASPVNTAATNPVNDALSAIGAISKIFTPTAATTTTSAAAPTVIQVPSGKMTAAEKAALGTQMATSIANAIGQFV